MPESNLSFFGRLSLAVGSDSSVSFAERHA